jgi:hypothetical protein
MSTVCASNKIFSGHCFKTTHKCYFITAFIVLLTLYSNNSHSQSGIAPASDSDSIVYGVWADYWACLSDASKVSVEQWRAERIAQMRELRRLGFNALMVPPREIELDLAHEAGWKSEQMLVLVHNRPAEETSSYAEYMNWIRTVFARYSSNVRGLYIDEPADSENLWMDASEGTSRMELLLQLLNEFDLPLFISGYAYYNENDMLNARDYIIPATGKPHGTPISHCGIIDAFSKYSVLFEQYGTEVIVFDDSWILPSIIPTRYDADQRPVLELFGLEILARQKESSMIAGAGMFVNLGFGAEDFSRERCRIGDPLQFAELIECFMNQHKMNPSFKYFFVYTGDVYIEMLNRLRTYYLHSRSPAATIGAGDPGSAQESMYFEDDGRKKHPCDIFKNLLQNPLIDSSDGHTDLGLEIHNRCKSDNTMFNEEYKSCLIDFFQDYSAGTIEPGFGGMMSEREQAFEKYIALDYDESWMVWTVLPQFASCQFYRDLSCSLFHLRLGGLNQAALDAQLIK